MEERKQAVVKIPYANSVRFLRWPWSGIFISLFSLSLSVFAHDNDPKKEPEYDEILIFFHADPIGSTEVPVVIRGRKLYLPVVDVLLFLGIRSDPSDGFNRVSGFFTDPEDRYLIDKPGNRIVYREKTHLLNPGDLVRTTTNLYLKSDYFGKVFGLECAFNFRTLSVSLTSRSELPAARKIRLEQMRSNISRLKREFVPDRTIGRTSSLFHLGTADWSVNTRQQTDGSRNTWLNLSLGGALAGGELEGKINYNDNHPFEERNQYYHWRYANNDFSALRQVMAGKIATQSISSIFTPVVGVQVTNTPTFRRRSFGTYTLQDRTQPGWIVELYVNNALVDYVKADASGFFTLDIPLVYGSTEVTLRYYGPWGEEQTSRKSFNIPYTFLPPNELEYTVSSGIVEDGAHSLFSQARVHYGLSRNVTVGGGLEYLSSVRAGAYMPFVNTSIRIDPNILLTGEHVYGVRSRGKLSYFSPSRLRFELNYTQYEPMQEAVRYNYTKATEAVIGMPFRLFNASFFSRLAISRNFLQSVQYNNARFELSGSAHGISMNLNTFAQTRYEAAPDVYTELSSAVMLPAKFIFDARTRYEHHNDRFAYLQLGLKRSLFGRGMISTSYERNIPGNLNYFRVGLVYNLSFASFSFSANHGKSGTSLFGSASGSLIHEPRANYLDFSRNRNTGRGGIILQPFLDLNANERRDSNEPKVHDLHVKGSGGHIERKNGAIVITGLEPYTNYFVELNGNDFDNIAWRINEPALSIAIEPNRLKLVEIPVAVVGEASGMVYLKEDNDQQGIGRVKICFYDMYSRLVASTLSEPDGFFSYLGLPPGLYKAKIDSGQLSNLQMSSVPDQQSFVIRESEDGDYIDHLKFILRTAHDAGATLLASEEGPRVQQTTAPAAADSLAYGVQLMTTEQKIALNHPAFKGLKDVQVHYSDGVYKYTWGEAESIEHARALEKELKERGFVAALAVPLDQNKSNVPAGEPKTDAYRDQSEAQDTIYRVQMLASRDKMDPEHAVFKGLKDIQVHYHDGLYTYTWGEVRSMEHARILENELKERGFVAAFIVPFNQNESDTLRQDQPATRDVVYRIQMLATQDRISPAHPTFKELRDIQEYYHEGLYKYTWGEVRSMEHARILQNELKERGFTGAFIVPFDGDERIVLNQAPEPLSNADTPVIKDLFYKVQIMASRRKIDPDHVIFKGLEGVQSYYHNNMHKYTWGKVRSMEQARVLENELEERGFAGAFIVPFYKNERTILDDIPALSAASGPAIKGLIFRVQVMASRNMLPLSHPLLRGLKNVQVHYDNGLYKYTWGETSSYKEAKKIQKDLKRRGFNHPFIVSFYIR